jgi:hypothetical protein
LRLAASLILIAASLVLLAWGFWPEGRTVQVLRLDGPDALPVRALRLEYPERVRLRDRALVRLTFEVEPEDGAPQPTAEGSDHSTAEAVHLIAEARLEVPNAVVRPPDSTLAALVQGRPPEFYWNVVFSAPGEHPGTAWSFLTIREGSSADSSRMALGAQSAKMRSITLLGMGGEAARIVGGLSLIGGIVLGLPFVESAARWLSRSGKQAV